MEDIVAIRLKGEIHKSLVTSVDIIMEMETEGRVTLLSDKRG